MATLIVAAAALLALAAIFAVTTTSTAHADTHRPAIADEPADQTQEHPKPQTSPPTDQNVLSEVWAAYRRADRTVMAGYTIVIVGLAGTVIWNIARWAKHRKPRHGITALIAAASTALAATSMYQYLTHAFIYG
jgi:Flp pilus assembly protein TadB